ncbi:pleiotropic drug resistance protein 2 [Corchorus olitorius]|uniref:Pleiotropic drug resistance protein 2 n=1 Tax=Corchorus olitorius TaxID=93759 RepID=A0A1R3HD48_9ROSI|nr:pleiotropic drug resistance protein 2 [Corchorus olitorius]
MALSEGNGRQEDEEELRWAAIERLPTYERLRKGLLRQIVDDGSVTYNEVDVSKLGLQEKKQLMDGMLKVIEDDNEHFLTRIRDRIDRVGIEIPKIEVRFEHLTIEGKVYVGSRALPTLLNATLNTVEKILGFFRLAPSKKRKIQILKDVSSIVKPSSDLLMTLAVQSTGKITYCGHELNEFVPQKTCAYISHHDLHTGGMTVRETLDFSGRCLGVGKTYEMIKELERREKGARIKPDFDIDAFMKAVAVAGQETSLLTDYVLKFLSLFMASIPSILASNLHQTLRFAPISPKNTEML